MQACNTREYSLCHSTTCFFLTSASPTHAYPKLPVPSLVTMNSSTTALSVTLLRASLTRKHLSDAHLFALFYTIYALYLGVCTTFPRTHHTLTAQHRITPGTLSGNSAPPKPPVIMIHTPRLSIRSHASPLALTPPHPTQHSTSPACDSASLLRQQSLRALGRLSTLGQLFTTYSALTAGTFSP